MYSPPPCAASIAGKEESEVLGPDAAVGVGVEIPEVAGAAGGTSARSIIIPP